jgi:aspartate/methionine/tyrosine aminotransferase
MQMALKAPKRGQAPPGVDFEAERGHRFLRFTFAGAEVDIARAVETLKAWRR